MQHVYNIQYVYLLNKYLKCSVWRLEVSAAVRHIYIYVCVCVCVQGVPGGMDKIRESVPYVELYRYNPKHLYPKSNGYGDNG